jgi:uncharacterized protein
MSKTTEFSFVLKPSTLGGIGVYAAHDIPEGMHLFHGNFSSRKMKTKEVPSEFLKYCIFVNDEECICPERFDRMEVGWYLNHSHNPNIAKRPEIGVIALRDIKAGEEILIDYNQLNEPEHLKESYYRKME